MNQLPPILRDQRDIDANHLKLLSIFHFVAAGLAVLGIGFLFLHYTILSNVFSNPKFFQNQQQGPPPAQMFAILKWFYLAFGLWFFGSLVLNLISAFFIRVRKNRTFSLVVAAINCLHIPLGTVLGVFTIIVLIRQSVSEVYRTQQSPALRG
jgi:hypothetical protein